MKAILTGTIDLIAVIDGQDGAPGTNGDNGTDGYNTAFISIYKRAASASAAGAPSGELVWNFANANFTSSSRLNGWSLNIPAVSGNLPCWVRQVKAVSKGNTYAIAASLWSTAVKLIENGKGISSIVRTYAISSVGTTTNDTTEPTINGSWGATQPAVTETYPYLWQKIVTTYTDSSTDTRYHMIGSRGSNGKDSISMLLSNGNDSMLYDGGGNLLSGQISSQVLLYKGGSQISASDITFAISSASGVSLNNNGAATTNTTSNHYTGANACWINKDGVVYVNGMNGTVGVIVITATYGETTYSTQLTLKKIVGIDKYELEISPNAVTYNSTTGALSVNGVGIRIWKTAQNGSRTNFSNPTLWPNSNWKLNVNGVALVTKTSASAYDSGDDCIVLPINSSTSNYQIVFTDGTNVLDSETVPLLIVANGGKGDAAVQYVIRIVTSDINVNPKGIILGGIAWNVYKIEGNAESLVSVNTGSHYIRLLGGSASGNLNSAGDDNNYQLDDDDNFYEHDWNTEGCPVSVELCFYLNNTKRASLIVPITIMGKMSRNLHYAGIWSSFSGSWVVTDYKAPYFAYVANGTTTYWAFIGSNGTWDKTSAGTPSASNGNWRQMVDEFKYLISDAIFTAFAKLGSAVFNGDYMFSQHGFMLGFNGTVTKVSDGSQYQHIDPNDVFGEIFDFQNTLTEVEAGPFPATPANTWCNITEWAMPGNGKLQKGSYYSIFVPPLTVVSGDTLEWRITTSSSSATGGTLLASGSFSPSDTLPYIANVYYNGDNDQYPYVWIKSTKNEESSLGTVIVKACKFVPSIALNLLTGEIHGASGKFRLFSNGDTYFKGTCLETVLEITPSNFTKYCFWPSWYNKGQTRCFDITKFGRIIRFTGDWSEVGSVPPIYLNTILSKMPLDYKFALRGLGDKKLVIFNDASNLSLSFVGGHMYNKSGEQINTYTISSGYMAMIFADYDIAKDNISMTVNNQVVTYSRKEYVERINWTLKSPTNLFITKLSDQVKYEMVNDPTLVIDEPAVLGQAVVVP